MRVLAPVLVAASLAASWPHAARADDSKVERADDLFRAAGALLAKKRYEEACPLLERSYQLDAAAGTLQNLALCRERTGELAKAYELFRRLREVASTSKPPRPDRVRLADDKLAALRGQVAFVTVVFEADDPRAGAAEILLDGAPAPELRAEDGGAVVAGTRRLEVRVDGRTVHTEPLVAAGGARLRVTVPKAEPEPPPEPPPATIAARAPADEHSPSPALPIALVASGGALLAGGLVFGALALSTESRADARCTDTSPGRTASDPSTGFTTGAEFDASGRCYADTEAFREANDLHGRARTFGTVSTILVPLGVVTAAAGAYVWLTRRKDATAAVSLSPRGMLLSGSF